MRSTNYLVGLFPSKAIVLGVLGAFLSLSPSPAFAQKPSYDGRAVNLVIMSRPGGLGDFSNRAIVPFLKKYIPGHPDIFLRYIPGAGGRKANNYMYKVARPDGLSIGWAGSALVANAVLGLPGVKYDINKLIYLGATSRKSHYVFFTMKEAGLDTLEKLRAASGVRIGGQSVGHHLYIQGRIFAYVLGLKDPRFVLGYSGRELDAAVRVGEVDTRISTTLTILRRLKDLIENGKMDLHAIMEIPKGAGRDSHFAGLPELEGFARSNRERKLIELWRALRSTGQPYILPPGTPKERVAVLREAFRKALKDPEFHKLFKKLTGNEFVPLLPEKIERLIEKSAGESETIAFLKKLAGAGPLPSR